jgi:hypothetical protein
LKWRTDFPNGLLRRDSPLKFFAVFQARIAEAEECIEGLTSKVATTEKIRNR